MSAIITITGNLAETPQLRMTSSGRATTRVRVAVDDRHRNNAGDPITKLVGGSRLSRRCTRRRT